LGVKNEVKQATVSANSLAFISVRENLPMNGASGSLVYLCPTNEVMNLRRNNWTSDRNRSSTSSTVSYR